MFKKILLAVLLFFVLGNNSLLAEESKYSFEQSEELMHKINWKSYSNQTIELAKQENKPVFLLLSAPSWCYWCQVYESEEYLFDPQIIEYLNKNFITIFVDADKRQDLTRQYLEGGWPSTTVLTPGMERIYGFSGVRPVPNMLENFAGAKEYVEKIGKQLSEKPKLEYLKQNIVIPLSKTIPSFIDYYQKNIDQSFDYYYGGFGEGQKFPQARTLDYLIDTGTKSNMYMVNKTMKNHYTDIKYIDSDYNLFDPIEGGFHRYGTTRDWSPPHYEKMLYDNAKLLKMYFSLYLKDEENKKVKEMVDKTLVFFDNYFIDLDKGGFYSDTSAYLEEEYYGLIDRAIHNKPRVEKTKHTPWNSEAIMTYLYIYEQTKDDKYKIIIEKSLDFFAENMIGKEGVYHFYTENGEKGVTGNLLDNSYLLLTFIEAYNILGDKKYLDISEKIAKYSLNNLYDYNVGGLFERNSKELDIYLEGERILLKKPFEENSIIALSLLKLYKYTDDLEYLSAGVKTIGNMQNSFTGLDKGYYFIKSIKLLENGLLEEYNTNKILIEKIESKKRNQFWLNEILDKQNILDGELKDEIAFIEKKEEFNYNIYFFGIVAFIAGILSFISPCTLPILPVFIANILTSNRQSIFIRTLLFLLGLNITFAGLGVLSGLFGSLINSTLGDISQVVGIMLLIFGILMLFGKGFGGFALPKMKFSSYFGSFLLGIFLALAWTPCDGPILVSILTLAGTTGNILISMVLLLLYGLGLSIPLILVAFFLNKGGKKSRILKIIGGKELIFGKLKIHTTHLISGIIFIVIGYLIFSGGLIIINEIFSGFTLQEYLSGFEEGLLENVK